jgi:hypothetical protein
MHHHKLSWLGIVVFLFSTTLFCQEFTGHVTDPSHAAVPKATIIVHNQGTNIDVTTLTTGAGDYTVPYLKPGTYTVTAVSGNFEQQSKTDIVLNVDQTATINFVLKVGSVSESVTVTAEALLDAGKADVGEVVENTRVTELPLNGRDPSTLAQLSSGVNWYGDKHYTRPFDQTEGALDINGGGEGNTVLMLDGVSNESPQGNAQVAYIPPVDAVQEFKIITNPYDAQFGRGQGGVIDMTLKSGTNALHGDVYEFARRGWLDSNTWANDYYGYAKGQHKQDQFGSELDGPIRLPKFFDGRDRAFFLLQYEEFKDVIPYTTTTSVPMPGWVDGDFSNATYYDSSTHSQQPLIIYDPLTVQPASDGSGRYLRTAFPNNKILACAAATSGASCINPVAQKILSYYPAPNVTPGAGFNAFSNNYAVRTPESDTYRNVLGKVDYNLTSKDRFTLRYGYWERYGEQSGNGMPGVVNQE